ncbi:hypothetical protein HKBW3S03_01577, partial [Candidatus Hakubella thermalkaliphila]
YLRTDFLYISGLMAGIIVFGGLGYIVGGVVGPPDNPLLHLEEQKAL